jgi:U3 small nucleolar RNA-associated protein 13
VARAPLLGCCACAPRGAPLITRRSRCFSRRSSPKEPPPPALSTPAPLQDEDFAEAARLAFELRHPGRLLAVLRTQGPAAAGPTAEALVRHLRPEDLKTALEYCRWAGAGGGVAGAGTLVCQRGRQRWVLPKLTPCAPAPPPPRPCREWNTNARNCHVAQAMLRALLSSRTPQELLAVPGACGGRGL